VAFDEDLLAEAAARLARPAVPELAAKGRQRSGAREVETMPAIL
jgi:hypothetical protein